jgi:hypothetical protein
MGDIYIRYNLGRITGHAGVGEGLDCSRQDGLLQKKYFVAKAETMIRSIVVCGFRKAGKKLQENWMNWLDLAGRWT